jgi:arylsulfatase A-like enzyme
VGLALACRHPAPTGEVVLDLVAALPTTDAAPATTAIAATDRAHLLEGWSAVDGADGEPRVWLTGASGSIAFEAGSSGASRTAVLSVVVDTPGPRPQPIVVRLNQQLVGTLRPVAGRHDLRIVLPAAKLRRGRNVLDVVTPGALARRRGLAGGRGLALVALRFESDAPPGARVVADGDRLRLPAGAAVSWFVAVPPAAWLVWDASAGPVRVTIQPDGAAARRPPVRRAGALSAVDLRRESGRLLRLTIGAEGDDCTLTRPRLLGRPPPHPEPAAAPATRPNVVLYVADTLRADRLGCYGYPRATSPHVDALAREGVVFERAVAQSSWTRPAVATIMTGRWPHEHGAVSLMSALRTDVATLAERLRAAGWATGAVVTNLNVAARFGFDRGFEHFDYLAERDERPALYASASELNAAALPWLAAQGERPFFLWLHASDPHAPYGSAADVRARLGGGAGDFRTLVDHPEQATADDIRQLSDLYDRDVGTLDAGFGEVMDALRRRGLDRSTLVVFLADHGEEFREHGGFEHGRTLHREVTRVPLVIRLPGNARAGERVATLARQVDVVPTILALAGLPVPHDLPGRPLLAAGTGDDPVALLETQLAGRRLVGLVRGPWKAVFDEARGQTALYNAASDPGETVDVAPGRPVVVGYARQAIARLRLSADRRGVAATVADPETERRLRALGYLD